MRILVVTETLNGNSGWGRYSQEMATELIALGHEVEALVQIRCVDVQIPQYALLPPPLSCLGNPIRPLQVANALRQTLKKVKPDIVHFMVEPYATCLAYMGACPPTILTIHGAYAAFPLRHGRIFSPWFAHQYLQRVDAIASVSQFTANILLQTANPALRSIVQPKITVIHNGVRLPEHVTYKKNTGSRFNILLVAALAKERKGILEAVKACAEFKKRSNADFLFTVIGKYDEQDPYIATIRRTIAEADMEQQVILRGRVSEEELNSAYAETDVFMLLSLQQGLHFEGFGLVFLEANARGIPVIGPTTGGCPEAISEDVSGYVCDPSNASMVAERLADVLVHKKISSEACIQWAKEHDIRRTAKSLAGVYESMLS